MSAAYLIDGYNLLYAMGVLHGRAGPSGLEKARRRLLGLLAGAFGEQAGAVTVVFDAANAPPGLPDEEQHKGLRVCYATRHDQADDLIEQLIRRDPAPRRLTVVSDDHRLKAAARRRDCTPQGCGDFLEWLDRRRRERRRPPPPPEKRDALSAGERQRWLDEFADLADDPDFKELFEPYEFER